MLCVLTNQGVTIANVNLDIPEMELHVLVDIFFIICLLAKTRANGLILMFMDRFIHQKRIISLSSV